MRRRSLQALVDAARALPARCEPVMLPRPDLQQRPQPGGVRLPVPEAAELAAQVRALLVELGARAETALPAALEQADRAWDQVDALRLADHFVQDQLAALRHDCQRALTSADAALVAAATHALWTAEAAMALALLLERRLATFVRLRLRADAGSLVPGGRPFLDLASALSDAARAWS
jgi:hypothetical protein